ncbi:hypothetical protein [Planctomyces sp. SH-PL62]|uniref:hypothetical protein n=1 Tax=Planctomyces sp. SH-PL62 TaxID=1636152 RepID=UPI00078B8434|nr:hypothetical protein [Planctomyces sp. SH-PL62]AMV39382.1 hypothetical protein VT85_18235 [Planctomyces sp. SH-PL62]
MTLATEPDLAAPFQWRRWPETESLINELTRQSLAGHAFAASLAERLPPETGTIFQNWLDHFVVAAPPSFANRLVTLGYERTPDTHSVGVPVYAHPGGVFPRIAVGPKPKSSAGAEPVVRDVGLKVESVAAFSGAHDLGLRLQGYPMGPLRSARVPGEGVDLVVVERRAYLGFENYPTEAARRGLMKPHAAREALAARDLWLARRRRFDDDAEGFAATEALVDEVIETAGSADLACHLIFEVERDYWQARNRAAQVQKARQDRFGLGWANHDHHTFRSSRRFFPNLIRIFTRLGFFLRERFHAGEHAGWGAQVLEHPTTGIVIFADLDLAPDEATQDFARHPLPDLARPGTVGLWVALHGESILEAGMHHLEAQFEFDALRDGLRAEAGIETMKPFSDFPFLRQAFTAGERWAVSSKRADRALAAGWITQEQRDKFVNEGTIGSHLENLQRREGFKGFNQQAVSAIIAATDPRLH